MSESTLDIIIDGKGAVAGGAQVGRVVGDLKLGFIDLAAKVFVAQQALTRLWTIAKEGAEFEETMGRLNRQMGAFHSTADAMVRDLQRISDGTVTIDKTAMMASRALSVGLNPNQVQVFTQAAMLLKDVMGTELPQAFDEIVQSSITGRSATLANIGVFVDLDKETRKLAASTGRTTEQITKQEKAMLAAAAIAKQIAGANERLGGNMLSDADKLEQVEAKWGNFWLKMTQHANSFVQGTMLGMDSVISYIAAHPGMFMPGGGVLKLLPPSGEDFGPPKPSGLRESPDGQPPPKIEIPFAIAAGALQDETARRDQILEADTQRQAQAVRAREAILQADAKLQLITQEELVVQKGAIALKEIDSQQKVIQARIANEEAMHRKILTIGDFTTQEKAAEEKRHLDKMTELNSAFSATVEGYAQQGAQNQKDLDIAKAQSQEELGRRIVANATSSYQMQEQIRQRDMADTEVYYKGEMEMADARFASDVEIAGKERELLRSQLAFKLRLTEEEVERLLFLRKAGDFEGVRQIAGRGDSNLSDKTKEGIIESGAATDMKLAERANDDFFSGWARGLQRYTRDRDSAFGMSQQMAQRTAQAMEQGFQRFFFDIFEQKITSLKDVMRGLLDFTKQIVSQMAAQFATKGLLQGLTAIGSLFVTRGSGRLQAGAPGSAIMGKLFGSTGGQVVRRYAEGGPVPGTGNQDTVPAMLTPGEFVLSRTDVSSIKRGLMTGGSTRGNVNIGITINAGSGGSKKSDTAGNGPQNFQQLARDLSKLVESKIIEEQRPGGLLAGAS